ncbi:hypothetical protein ACFYQ5_19530 [Streptomyces sp. NPDC005794]|uniref:hypothetical protein n=1 Tax=Streptomyces sp. NPDC005794 TaxID=3364733 RepID=UPI00368F960B
MQLRLACRRQMNRQLTVEESRHKLARNICDDECPAVRRGYCPDATSVVGVFGNFGMRLDMSE